MKLASILNFVSGRQRAARRQCERTKSNVPCRLVVGDQVLVGSTRDISEAGLFFRIPVDSSSKGLARKKARASLLLPKGECQLPVLIVRVQKDGIAVKFAASKGDDELNALVDFLKTQLSRLV